jgi:predicted enzyme related to lactoylglutathione lyase
MPAADAPGTTGWTELRAPDGGPAFDFRVDSIHAAAQRVARLGGTVTVPPDQVPGDTWVLHGRDQQGAVFALLSVTK